MKLSWSGRWLCHKKELESFIGRLSHASSVVQLGKTFLRQFEVDAQRFSSHLDECGGTV